jgi:hypothetical protein
MEQTCSIHLWDGGGEDVPVMLMTGKVFGGAGVDAAILPEM